MKQKLKLLIPLMFAGLQTLCQVAQPGENIWHVAAGIGTEMDQVAQAITIYCQSKTATVQDILNEACTINSKLDVLETTVESDFSAAFSALAQISCSSGGCTVIPLTVPSMGTTISTAGTYCLANDQTYTSTAITITANDVALDLNNHTITSAASFAGISVIGSHVVIKNGSINSATSSTGISIASTAQDVTIKQIKIFDCKTGISATTTKDLVLSDITIDNDTLASSIGISLNTISNCVIENCITARNITGFLATLCACLTFQNCTANGAMGAGSTGFHVTNSSGVIFDSCFACNHDITGFLVDGTAAHQTTCFTNCIAFGNTTATSTGFSVTQNDTNSTCRYMLENCKAMITGNSSSGGFNLGRSNGILTNCIANNTQTNFGSFTTTSSNQSCLFRKCCAANNGDTGGLGFFSNSTNQIFTECLTSNNTTGFSIMANATPGNGNCVIELSSATNNSLGIGFEGDGSNSELFYLNNAINNGTNYANLRSQSAPEMALTSTGRLYGDNLANIIP